MNRNDQHFMAEKIRTQYMPKQTSELDELRRLDAKVKRPANVFAYVFGIISAIIMGAGMSLVMTDIGDYLSFGDPMVIGIVIGVAGLALALINYPIYKSILSSRKKQYAEQIMALSERIINQ
ncbi:MAG: dihydropteridine reductase [Ruminococcaceae bacterium]|nr:dihydropteridine reductase [Oscillospiraceae bacterium]